MPIGSNAKLMPLGAPLQPSVWVIQAPANGLLENPSELSHTR
jgi:hypothetical protein